MKSTVEILRHLVSLDTVSDRPTAEAVGYLRALLEPAGFTCAVHGRGPHRNLVARNDAAIAWNLAGRKHTALCAHIDTVPFDAELWTGDPLTLRERNGKLVGLGAADMKGPLACMLVSLLDLAAHSPDLPLALVVTHHEETALEGARELVRDAAAMQALRTMQLVIGEPTGLALGYAHKGVHDFTITIVGRSAHSGNPQRGLNAVYGAAAIIETIAALDDEWRRTSTGPERNTVNVGTIQGGDVRNRVPGVAVVTGDMRIVPGSTSALLTDVIESELTVLSAAGYRCELTCDYEAAPFEMDLESGFIPTLAALLGTEPVRLGYATDASVFQAEAGIECAILGPGDIHACHMPDEFIESVQLDLGVAVYRAVLSGRAVDVMPGRIVSSA